MGAKCGLKSKSSRHFKLEAKSALEACVPDKYFQLGGSVSITRVYGKIWQKCNSDKLSPGIEN